MDKGIPHRAIGEQSRHASGGSTPVIGKRCFLRLEWPGR